MVKLFKRFFVAVIIVSLLFSACGCSYSDSTFRKNVNEKYSLVIPDTCRCVYANTDTWGGFPSVDGISYYIYEVGDSTDDFFSLFNTEADEFYVKCFNIWKDSMNGLLKHITGEENVVSGDRLPDYSEQYLWCFRGVKGWNSSENCYDVGETFDDIYDYYKQVYFTYIPKNGKMFAMHVVNYRLNEDLVNNY